MAKDLLTWLRSVTGQRGYIWNYPCHLAKGSRCPIKSGAGLVAAMIKQDSQIKETGLDWRLVSLPAMGNKLEYPHLIIWRQGTNGLEVAAGVIDGGIVEIDPAEWLQQYRKRYPTGRKPRSKSVAKRMPDACPNPGCELKGYPAQFPLDWHIEKSIVAHYRCRRCGHEWFSYWNVNYVLARQSRGYDQVLVPGNNSSMREHGPGQDCAASQKA